MRTLVLGGSGFIGSHLVDRLLADGHTVRVLDRRPERYRAPVPGVDYYYADAGNREIAAAALAGMDIVFHLICDTIPLTSNDDPVHDITANLAGTVQLLQSCVAARIKKFVFVSSGGTVYGRPHHLPVSEENATEPECSYGIVKLAIEKYLRVFQRLRGLEYVVLRPSNPYGPRQDPFGSQGAVAVFLGGAARGEAVTIWGDGTVVRDYLFVEDLVEGIPRAALAESPTRIFNLGSGKGISLNDLVWTIERVINGKVHVVHNAPRAFDVPSIYLDIQRATRELAWRPQTTLEEGIRRSWEFVRAVAGGRHLKHE
jgi:UDP-glucose 4-epimerase